MKSEIQVINKNNVALIEADAVVASMMRASSALAQAQTIQQTKKVLDVAHAAEIYAKRQHLGEEAMGIAASIKVEALRKLGEMLQVAPKATGKAGPGRGKAGTKSGPAFNDAPTLEELGLTKKESAVAQKLAALSEEAFEQVREGNVTVAKVIAAVNRAKPAQEKSAQSDLSVAADKPALVVVQDSPPEDDGPDASELAANEQAVRADVDAMQKLLDSDDKLSTAYAEIKRLNAELSVVKLARDGYMNKVNEQIKIIKRLQSKVDKLEKASA